MFPQQILHSKKSLQLQMPVKEGHESILSMLSLLHQKKQLKIGINSVFRSLQKSRIKIIIVTYDINPPDLIEHILTLSSNQNVPIIPINFNKQKLGETLGIRSAGVVGILDTVSDDIYQLLLPFSTTI